MGYRLEVSKIEYCDCGGKLFGYIPPSEMKKCKSAKWLYENHFIDSLFDEGECDYEFWYQTYNPQIIMDTEQYQQFIKLYIEDYNKFSPYGNKLSLDDFKETLNASYVLVEWC